MRRTLLALLLAGCAGIESDIDRTERHESFMNLFKGKDRGLGEYSKTIEKSITKLQGGHYQYVPPAHISNWYVDWSVRGIGGTKLPNSDYLAGAADRLLYVMAYDPTGALRSTAAEQLGRLLLPLPIGSTPLPVDGNADIRINQIADDLLQMAAGAHEGKKVPVSSVVERMRALSNERPRSLLSALQMVRALATAPIVGASGPIRETAEEIGPAIVRDSILVALRDVSVGLPDMDPDDAPIVRQCAIEVLTRVGSPVAQRGAVARLQGGIDPPEGNPDVRCALVAYLGSVGGPGALDVCIERLNTDLDVGVRFYAQASLQQLTGARADPTPEAWNAVIEERARHPAKASG